MIAKVLRRGLYRLSGTTFRVPLLHSSQSNFSGVIKYHFDDDEYERAPYEVVKSNFSIHVLLTKVMRKS